MRKDLASWPIRLCVVAACGTVSFGQSAPPTPSHQRAEKVEVTGKRVALQSLKGATLFTASGFKKRRIGSLLIHFHGAPWLIERHIAGTQRDVALITVQLGAGSSAYGRPFADPELFGKMIGEAAKELGLVREWRTIVLTGFSAGYGAVRAILRQPENYERVSSVLLLDGIHASYQPEGIALSDGGVIASRDLDSFLTLANDAVAGKKRFVITHSEIVPGTYASTTECVDYILSKVGLVRSPKPLKGPIGMKQTSSARKHMLRVFGYAGDSAPDHVDHLHAMAFWFRYLDFR
jgi:hypothetical protein